jgi:hypothetical protein
MDKNIDFTRMSNAEINLKMMSYDNEYNVKKSKIISLVEDLKDLDKLYIKASEELKKRGILKDG